MRSRSSVLASRLLVVAFSAIIFTGAKCQPTVRQSAVDGNKGGAVTSTATQLVQLLNQERANRGANLLVNNSAIAAVAQQYSDDLATGNSSYYNFAINGNDGQTRLRNAGLSFTRVGHIGATDFQTAQTVLNALIADNTFVLTSNDYSRIGIGVKATAASNYWTILVLD